MTLDNKNFAMHGKTRGWKAYVTDRGWVGGLQNGDYSHFCAKFFRLDFKHSNLQILCFYDVGETKPNFFSMMKTWFRAFDANVELVLFIS